jgi:hypothetical protein
MRWFNYPVAASREAVTTAVVALSACTIEFALRVCSLARIARVIGVPVGVTAGRDSLSDNLRLSAAERRRLRGIVRVMGRWRVARGTCLRRALLTAWALRGRQPTVVVGVRRTADGDLRAHAWVEVDGLPLGAHAGYLTLTAAGPAQASTW